MTLDHAAEQHADRDRVKYTYSSPFEWWVRRDVAVRAFRAGAQFVAVEVTKVLTEHAHSTREIVKDCYDVDEQRMCGPRKLGWNPSWVKVADVVEKALNEARVEALTNSPRPSTGTTASTGRAESDPRGKS